MIAFTLTLALIFISSGAIIRRFDGIHFIARAVFDEGVSTGVRVGVGVGVRVGFGVGVASLFRLLCFRRDGSRFSGGRMVVSVGR